MSTSSPFGMAPSLVIPIAGTFDAITHHVGPIQDSTRHVIHAPRNGSHVVAFKIQARRPRELPDDAPLWSLPEAQEYFDVLHAAEQLWVHVDYTGYRSAWFQLMRGVPPDIFLDHVQNRRSTGLRNNVYPYIRLVPVPRRVNTNAGHRAGGEGMEYAYTQRLKDSMSPDDWQRALELQVGTRGLVYADPFDLTKMLSLSPGTQTLDGVRDFQRNFFARSA